MKRVIMFLLEKNYRFKLVLIRSETLLKKKTHLERIFHHSLNAVLLEDNDALNLPAGRTDGV